MKKLNVALLGSSFLFLLLLNNGCKKDVNPKAIRDFKQVNLVSNNNQFNSSIVDTFLQNAWGLVFNPGGIAWVNGQASHVSNIYNKEGVALRPPVAIPSHDDSTGGGSPTGIVFNGTTDFVLSNGKPAAFLFVGDDGILSGWNGAAGNHALLIKDRSASSSYTGLTMGVNGGANFIYAANFKTGKIDVWDKDFHFVSMPFTDPHLPMDYSPFNIQSVGDWLYIAYAKVGPDGDEVKVVGDGIVDIFKTNGDFVRRFASKGTLDAPWGITDAPAGFFIDNDGDKDDKSSADNKTGVSSNNNQKLILIGNFGDGRINVFTMDGQFAGQLKAHGRTITIRGLWALRFPPATATAVDPNRLYFTAGPNDEKDGLFGYLIKE